MSQQRKDCDWLGIFHFLLRVMFPCFTEENVKGDKEVI